MVKRVFTFEVAPEKQSEYFKATAEKIKPFWESHGCQSYDVWQAAEGEPTFIKEMIYPDIAAMQKSMGLYESDAQAKAMVGLFMSFVTNLSQRTHIQKI
jgi:quinol monooxygenase YgiN